MSEEQTHILTNFDKALHITREDLTQMSSLAKRNLDLAIRGLLNRETPLCTQVIAEDEDIDQLDMKIDRETMQTLMLYQPVAADLRQLVSMAKVASNLERVADLAVGIAKRARKLNQQPEVQEARLVEPIYKQAAELLADSLRAFTDGDISKALAIKERDEELDKAHKELSKALATRMEENKANIRDYLNLIFIVRHLERVGDHAKNIAEEAVFVESAQDIRHGADRTEAEEQAAADD